MKLKIENKEFKIKWEKSELAQKISDNFPLELILDGKYGEELYVLTDFGLELDKNAKEVFEIGDIVYWVKSDKSKEAIAIFFGNTPAGDGTRPRPVSKCNLIGKIIGEVKINDNVGKGSKISLA